MGAIIIDLDEKRRRRRLQDRVSPSPPVQPNLDRLSQRDNPYAVVNEAFHIVLFRRGTWSFRIEDLETGQGWFSERQYQTEEAARADALLAVGQLQGKAPERKA